MKKGILVAVLLIVAGAIVWYLYSSKNSVVPVTTTAGTATTSAIGAATSTSNVSNTPKASVPTKVTLGPVSGESVQSWNFKGAYTGNTELIQKAQTEIQRLKGLLGTEAATDYSVYISVANQYDLMGDSKQELAYLQKALDIDSQTGLAWANAGQLFEKLGAYKTARVYLEKSVEVQPTNQSHRALLDFLLEHYPQDAAAIQREKETLQIQ